VFQWSFTCEQLQLKARSGITFFLFGTRDWMLLGFQKSKCCQRTDTIKAGPWRNRTSRGFESQPVWLFAWRIGFALQYYYTTKNL